MKDIVLYPDPKLRIPSTPVNDFGSSLTDWVEEMTDTMRLKTSNGIGITAVQCGLNVRIALLEMNFREKKKGKPMVLCNPIILDKEGEVLTKEGCLSFPDQYYLIKRPHTVRVAYQNVEGLDKITFLHEIFARCICHEIDHMDGILFIDRAKEQGQAVNL